MNNVENSENDKSRKSSFLEERQSLVSVQAGYQEAGVCRCAETTLWVLEKLSRMAYQRSSLMEITKYHGWNIRRSGHLSGSCH